MSSTRFAGVFCFTLFTLTLSAVPVVPWQAGGVQAEGARFAMEDPRTIFYLPEDRQVIVYAEWDGPLGKHHIEGFWKSPAGKTAALTDFDYDAKLNRFGAYFTLSLNDGMDLGAWSLEAHVDGEVAGTHSFQILAGKRPADALPLRKMLTRTAV